MSGDDLLTEAEQKERPAMREALRLSRLRPGPPTEADAPPPSTFPMTPGAKAARRYDRAREKRIE